MLWWHTQYEMRQKLLLPSAVSVMSYYDGTTLSFTLHPRPVLRHGTTKDAFAPATVGREAER